MTERVPIKTHPPFHFFGDINTFNKIQEISFGWKFHVAATPETFNDLFFILEPEIAKHSFILKCFIRPEELNNLKDTIQEGKAFTIYLPQDNLMEALRFAIKVSKLLSSFAPFSSSLRIKEQAFQNSQFLYYRFGEYEANQTIISKTFHPLFGTVFACKDGHKWTRDRFGNKWLIGSNDELWQDRNWTSYKPQWINDPFN